MMVKVERKLKDMERPRGKYMGKPDRKILKAEADEDKFIKKHVENRRWKVLWNCGALIINDLTKDGIYMSLADYWGLMGSISVNKHFKGIHNNSGRIKRYLYWRKMISTSIKKLVKVILSNRGIMALKIWVQLHNISCIIIGVIYWCIFRDRSNGNNSSSVNIISCIKTKKI